MNFSPKCLIFFLNVLISTAVFGAPEIGNGHQGGKSDHVIKKKTKSPRLGPSSPAVIRLKANWQVIESLGKGAKMSATVETYAADASLFQSTPHNWWLKIGVIEIPVTFTASPLTSESVLFAESAELLRLLEVELTEEDRLLAAERAIQSDSQLSEGVRLVVGKTPSRQLETIYRSPGEGMFLVKASLTFIK